MDLAKAIGALKEDRSVVQAFAELLLHRVRQRTGHEDVRLEDIELKIEVRLLNGPAQIHRLLSDLIKESVSI